MNGKLNLCKKFEIVNAANGGDGMPEMGKQRDKHNIPNQRDSRGL